MAQHSVDFVVPERPLGKADVEFKVKRDGEALGRLKVSNGTIVWVPKNCKYGFKMNWPDFAQIMESEGKKE